MQMLILKTVRIWCINHQPNPMFDIENRGLGDIVEGAIPLKSPSKPNIPVNRIAHSEGATPVNLALYEQGISKVHRAYGPIDFDLLSDLDPIIMAQNAQNLDSKRAHGYAHIFRQHHLVYAKYHSLAAILGYRINRIVIDWFDNTLDDLDRRLISLGPQASFLGRGLFERLIWRKYVLP